MVFQRKVDNSIKFQYDWDLADDFKIKDPITSQVYSGDLISFSSTISFNKNQRLVELSGFQYNIFQGESLSLSIGMENLQLQSQDSKPPARTTPSSGKKGGYGQSKEP